MHAVRRAAVEAPQLVDRRLRHLVAVLDDHRAVLEVVHLLDLDRELNSAEVHYMYRLDEQEFEIYKVLDFPIGLLR